MAEYNILEMLMTEEKRQEYIKKWGQVHEPEFPVGSEVVLLKIDKAIGVVIKCNPNWMDEREDCFTEWTYDVELLFNKNVYNDMPCYWINFTEAQIRKNKIDNLL